MWCTVPFKMYCAFLCGSLFGWTVCLHDGPGAAWNRPRGSNFQFMRMRIGEKGVTIILRSIWNYKHILWFACGS